MKSFLKIAILALLLSSFVSFSHAQLPSSLDGVEIKTNPINPSPGQNITISVESFITDLNSASIVWLVDGKSHEKGTGVKSITIPAPVLGKNMTVTVAIMTNEGKEVRKSITIKSGSVDIIWESDGYTPPFYKGKSLFAYENGLRITAIPHLAASAGTLADPKTLVYKWKKNGKVIQDQSGHGKQTLFVKDDLPISMEIEVEVTTKDGSQKAVSSIALESTDPSITFYEDNPLYGVLYNKSIVDRVNLSDKEVTIKAVPYSFNTNYANSPLTYLWSINNLERQDLSTNQSITLRTKGDVDGSSQVSLQIRNSEDILQAAEKAIQVLFSKKPVGTTVTFQ